MEKRQDNQEQFYEQLRTAVMSGDIASLEAIVFRVGTRILELGAFPAECFEGLIAIVNTKEFEQLTGSWKLLRVFEENWDSLSEEQRDNLLPALERAYGQFADWMAPFVISGILGECYKDERALASLVRLKSCSSEIPRSFVAHGLEHLVVGSPHEAVTERAFAELKALEMDTSSVVRGEVNESFSRIKKGGHVPEGNG
jgi:hypothetical protein